LNSIKISIIVASLNNVNTVESTILSILNQKYKNIEIIVIDGNSIDGTQLILEKYKHLFSKYICESDYGLYFALNKGINFSTGDVVGFLHADDVFYDSDVLLNVLHAFQDNSLDSVYGDLVYVKRNNLNKINRYWKSSKISINYFQYGWMPPHPTLYIRRTVYLEYGLFDTNYSISADYDLILRFFLKCKINSIYINKIFVRMRLGGTSNKSINNILKKLIEDYKIIRNNKVGGFITILFKNLYKLKQYFFIPTNI